MQILDDGDVKRIFMEFQSDRLSQVFGTGALDNLHEMLVDIFRGSNWMGPGTYHQRTAFVKSLAQHAVPDQDHRTLFRALAESGNTYQLKAYLDLIGKKRRVKLSDGMPLLVASEVLMMVQDNGLDIANNITTLVQVMLPDDPDSVKALWSQLYKQHDPSHEYSARWLQALQSMVDRFGLSSLGLGKTNIDHRNWVKHFFETQDSRTFEISGAILAGLLGNHLLKKQELAKTARDLSGQIRLIKTLGFTVNDFEAELAYKQVFSSHSRKDPGYRI